jgi:hypothetical protein
MTFNIALYKVRFHGYNFMKLIKAIEISELLSFNARLKQAAINSHRHCSLENRKL